MPETVLPNKGLKFDYDLGVGLWKPGIDANFVIQDTLGGQAFVINDALLAEPVAPSVGDAYILPTGVKTGTNWGTDTGAVTDAIALFTNIPGQPDSSPWLYLTPREGWMVFERTSNQYQIFNGVAWNSQLTLPQVNNAAAPTFAFGDGDTGFYEIADDTIGVSLIGVSRFVFTGSFFRGALTDAGAILDETASATNPTLLPSRNDTDTGIGLAAADQLALIAGGVRVANLTELAGVVQLIVPLQNNAAAPSIAFGDGDTGFFESADDTISLSLAGSARFNFTTSGLTPSGVSTPEYNLRHVTATATVPVFCFNPDIDTGIGTAGNDQLSLIAGGVEGVRITEVAAVITVNVVGALTANSYGGILEANLLDKTATEVFSGSMRFNNKLILGSGNSADQDVLLEFDMDREWAFIAIGEGAGNGLALRALDSGKSFEIQNSVGTSMFQFITSTTLPELRIFEGVGVDHVRFNHDGLDFNILGINTTDLNISGMNLRVVNNIGFYNTAPVAQPTGVAVTAAGIHVALVTLGLITA